MLLLPPGMPRWVPSILWKAPRGKGQSELSPGPPELLHMTGHKCGRSRGWVPVLVTAVAPVGNVPPSFPRSTCKNRRWECSHLPCLGTCVAYGDGHFITFDGEWYSFDGSCEYTLAQDHCGGNGSTNGTFRIVTENVPCGTTGVTCSKAIKLFLEVRGIWNILPQSAVTSPTLSHLQRRGTWPPAVSCLGAARTSGTAPGP